MNDNERFNRLVKLRDQMATDDTEETAAADRITEVLAMSAAPVEPSKAEPIEQPTPLPVPAGLDPRGAAICERPFGCIACQGPPTPLSEHRHRTIEALLTAIDREATDPTGHDPAGLDGAQRAERLANAVALLAGASL